MEKIIQEIVKEAMSSNGGSLPIVENGSLSGAATMSVTPNDLSPEQIAFLGMTDVTSDIVPVPVKRVSPKRIDKSSGTLKATVKASNKATVKLADKAIDTLSYDECRARLAMQGNSKHELSLLTVRLLETSDRTIQSSIATASMNDAQKAQAGKDETLRELNKAQGKLVDRFADQLATGFLATGFFSDGRRKSSEHYSCSGHTVTVKGTPVHVLCQMVATTDIPVRSLSVAEKARNKALKRTRLEQEVARQNRERAIQAMCLTGIDRKDAEKAYVKQVAAEKRIMEKKAKTLMAEKMKELKTSAMKAVRLGLSSI